jgi:hypothetical protein
LRIDVDEDLLDRDLERPVLGDDAVQALEDDLQARGERAASRFDAAARDISQLRPVRLDDAEPRALQPRIYPEDLQSSTAVV